MTRISIALLLAVMASSIWLVRVQYESRRLSTEWHRVSVEARQLEVEHQRLLVEKRAQATPLRVERLASDKLRMRTPTPATTLYVAADGSSLEPAAGGKP
ncbi:MAG: cell division protein FtsL [Comamonas sp. SCN 67-35]|uniref:cell division protein FtsL n=1 Tax=unclassified Comamonas TaxID=2638500 RepID=UPI00086CA6EA|nr:MULTISPECIES: cell division protein FtsL [unclassified Comamonas]MBN9329622.1 cell division protein FtsL [Comamonas sp.]ODU37780.1 MAG: cell division protein FtsL [Comamonas sp. SCN 67-35]OJX02981.1 MAG: cell division protein FtsL [Burkholderiales bacterium 66-26]TAN09552.1 MAG: cell division protein FtsL [Chitinophagaceae bacterium]